MTGLVGIIANDAGRYSLFPSCVTNLRTPPGSEVEWLIGGDWCGARNRLAELTIVAKHDWLWFMDDDHAFPPSLLERLLAHDLPLVTPVCLARVAPFPPVQYTGTLPDGSAYLPIPLADQPETGLVKLEAGGCAGMLIRREVLEAIDPPWFEYSHRSEDILFCEKAKAAGFDIYCDLEARLGHITTAVVWPAVVDGEWQTGLTVGRDMQLSIPTAQTQIEQKTPEPNPWTWTLRRGEVVVNRAYVRAGFGYAFDPPPGRAPIGVLQWYLDKNDGTGEQPEGEPFTYYPEEATA